MFAAIAGVTMMAVNGMLVSLVGVHPGPGPWAVVVVWVLLLSVGGGVLHMFYAPIMRYAFWGKVAYVVVPSVLAAYFALPISDLFFTTRSTA